VEASVSATLHRERNAAKVRIGLRGGFRNSRVPFKKSAHDRQSDECSDRSVGSGRENNRIHPRFFYRYDQSFSTYLVVSTSSLQKNIGTMLWFSGFEKFVWNAFAGAPYAGASGPLSHCRESVAPLLKLKHYDLGIRSQAQGRSPRSCSARSEDLHLPDPA